MKARLILACVTCVCLFLSACSPETHPAPSSKEGHQVLAVSSPKISTESHYMEDPALLSEEEQAQVLAEFNDAETKDLSVCASNMNPCPDWAIIVYPWAPVWPGDATIVVYDDPRGGRAWLLAGNQLYSVNPMARQPKDSTVWTLTFTFHAIERQWWNEDLSIYLRYGGNATKRILQWRPPR